MYFSVFESEQELLKAILDLNNIKQIDLDPMYFKGNFYKEINKPKYISDLNPQNNEIDKQDATKLPYINNFLDSIILDPPFMFGIHGKTKEYYSSGTHGILKDFNELELLYKNILKEAHRILKKDGILIFKCQDFTDSKTTLVHCNVYNWANEIGFYAKDLAILSLKKGKVYNSNLKQRHLRKIHSYFFVFKKV
jgi:tRNA G10  N-methylase Trm11